MPAIWLNSDKIRGAIFDNPIDVEPELRYDAVFEAIDRFAEAVMKAKQNVIYDANNHKREHRDNHSRLARSSGGRAVVVYVVVAEAISDQRAAEREINPHQIRLTAKALKKHKRLIEPPDPSENLIIIDGNVNFEKQFESFQEQLLVLRKNWGKQ